jgi:diadenosine tetraphosphate (Ap4A) HIT family hydrolase
MLPHMSRPAPEFMAAAPPSEPLRVRADRRTADAAEASTSDALSTPASSGAAVATHGSTRARAVSPVHHQSRPGCRFCEMKRSNAQWDQPLWESERFVAVPSKGGFVPGWMLVVPRSHALNLSMLDPDAVAELERFVELVSSALRTAFGDPTLFEHGAVSENTTFGCGIDHAHMHLVPLPRGFGLRRLAESAIREPFLPHQDLGKGAYLRVREPLDDHFYSLVPRSPPPRQFFRRVIWAASAWHGTGYDYDSSPCVDVVDLTIRRFEKP